MTSPAIVTSGLTKRFGSLIAVNDLSFEVAPGEIVGFLGPNGAGKTTTIRLLLGFLNPSAGTCGVLGGSLRTDIALRRRVGYLPGDFRLDTTMTGNDLFRWFATLRGISGIARASAIAERLELDPTRRFGTLSKGNRQKVGIVQAFFHDPDVLILDEPTSGLDPLIQREFLALVRDAAARGAAVLFSSHVLPEVEHLAHRVAMIRSGRLLRLSTVDDALEGARQRLHLRFADPVDPHLFTAVPGVTAVEIEGTTATITVSGPVGPALRAATSGPGLLRISSDGDELEELFVSLYDPNGDGA